LPGGVGRANLNSPDTQPAIAGPKKTGVAMELSAEAPIPLGPLPEEDVEDPEGIPLGINDSLVTCRSDSDSRESCVTWEGACLLPLEPPAVAPA
jgi:hypothetical protein